MTVYVKVRLPESRTEWREIREAKSLIHAALIAEKMSDVEAVLETSLFPGGVVT